jgi:hypothetical protein
MDFQQAKDEFAVRYYRWALEDSQREVKEGFPFLHRIKGTASLRLLAAMESLQQEEQTHFSVALVKRFHLRALKLLNEHLTAEENELCRDYVSSILIPIPEEQEIERRIKAGTFHLRVNRKNLATLIKKELEPVLGNPSEIWGPREWWYMTSFGSWNVRTNVHMSEGHFYQLNYHHSIHPVDSMYELENWMSVLSWLGITSMTNWDLLTDADIPEAAETLAQLCSHFIQAVPSLLEGLVLD